MKKAFSKSRLGIFAQQIFKFLKRQSVELRRVPVEFVEHKFLRHFSTDSVLFAKPSLARLKLRQVAPVEIKDFHVAMVRYPLCPPVLNGLPSRAPHTLCPPCFRQAKSG